MGGTASPDTPKDDTGCQSCLDLPALPALYLVNVSSLCWPPLRAAGLKSSVSMTDDPSDRLVLGPLTPTHIIQYSPDFGLAGPRSFLWASRATANRATWDQSVSLKIWFFGKIRGSAKFDPVS